jgi:hypothetical protein
VLTLEIFREKLRRNWRELEAGGPTMNSCVSFLRFCDGALDSRIAEAGGDPDVPPFPRSPRSYPSSGRSFLEQVNASPLTDSDGATPSAAAAAASEATLSLASRLEELLGTTSMSGAAGVVGRDADPSSAVSFHQHVSKWYALRRVRPRRSVHVAPCKS